jgi:serine protease Do
MRKRDALFILIGILVCVVCLWIYHTLSPKPVYNYPNDIILADLNEEISKRRSNAIVLAANLVSPSVVSISVIQTQVVSTSPFFSPFSDELFREFFKDFFPEYYHKKKIKSLGTGVIISPDGYILTNEHLISNATDINITLPDSRQFKGKIVASDWINDRALLKIDGEDLPFANLGNSDDLMIGEWVIALGNPFGFLLEDTRPTVTVGVVSALNRSIKSTQGERVYKNMVQTDAAINPGNSGGPLVNVLAQVIGINTFIFTSGGGSEGIGFAQPINGIKKFITEAKKFGKVRTPWIGLWVQDVSPETVEDKEIGKAGVLVRSVDLESSAQKAGIKEGDIIISVNSDKISSVSDWDRAISNVYVDDVLDINLRRDNKTIDIKLVVKELKDTKGVELSRAIYGMHLENIDSRFVDKYKLGYTEGVVVTKVEPNSIGEKLGIMPGDVILMAGNVRIRNKNDFQKIIENLRNINLIIDRGGIIIQLYFGA